MSAILQNPLLWLAATVVLVAAAFVVGARIGGRASKPVAAPTEQPAAPGGRQATERVQLRAASVDALAEAVLLTDGDGQVMDCNSSALTLFDRHRGEIEGQFAAALRRFDGPSPSEPHRIATDRAVWVGEGWVRLPDGAMRLCHVRVIAIRDERARVLGFAESFRDVAQDRNIEEEFRDLLYGVRAFESTETSSESLTSVREELRVLSESFRDLDHVLRQYERLLPSLGPDDPLSEAIAGAAHDARTAVAAVGVPALLEEIPRALSRLRGHLQVLSAELQTRSTTSAPRDEIRPTGARRP